MSLEMKNVSRSVSEIRPSLQEYYSFSGLFSGGVETVVDLIFYELLKIRTVILNDVQPYSGLFSAKH